MKSYKKNLKSRKSRKSKLSRKSKKGGAKSETISDNGMSATIDGTTYKVGQFYKSKDSGHEYKINGFLINNGIYGMGSHGKIYLSYYRFSDSQQKWVSDYKSVIALESFDYKIKSEDYIIIPKSAKNKRNSNIPVNLPMEPLN